MQRTIEFSLNANLKPELSEKLLQMNYKNDYLLGILMPMKVMRDGKNSTWSMSQLPFRFGAFMIFGYVSFSNSDMNS